MPIVSRERKDMDTILIESIWEFNHIPPSEGVRTNDWKDFRCVNNKTIPELYNLKVDLKEIHNLVNDEKYRSNYWLLERSWMN